MVGIIFVLKFHMAFLIPYFLMADNFKFKPLKIISRIILKSADNYLIIYISI